MKKTAARLFRAVLWLSILALAAGCQTFIKSYRFMDYDHNKGGFIRTVDPAHHLVFITPVRDMLYGHYEMLRETGKIYCSEIHGEYIYFAVLESMQLKQAIGEQTNLPIMRRYRAQIADLKPPFMR